MPGEAGTPGRRAARCCARRIPRRDRSRPPRASPFRPTTKTKARAASFDVGNAIASGTRLLQSTSWNGSTSIWPTRASARGGTATRSSPPAASRSTASASPTSGCKIDPETHQISVDDQPVRAEKLVYWVVNKPVGYLCTNSDPAGRPRAIDLLAARRAARLHRRPARRGQRRPAPDDQRRRPRDASSCTRGSACRRPTSCWSPGKPTPDDIAETARRRLAQRGQGEGQGRASA